MLNRKLCLKFQNWSTVSILFNLCLIHSSISTWWLVYKLFYVLIETLITRGWEEEVFLEMISLFSISMQSTLLQQHCPLVDLEIYVLLQEMQSKLLLSWCSSLLGCCSILKQSIRFRVSWSLTRFHQVIMRIKWLKLLRISLSKWEDSCRLIDKFRERSSLTGKDILLDSFNTVQMLS